jgi:hypothetical protein
MVRGCFVGFPPPNDAPDTLNDFLISRNLYFELQQRPGWKGLGRLDVHAAATDIV